LSKKPYPLETLDFQALQDFVTVCQNGKKFYHAGALDFQGVRLSLLSLCSGVLYTHPPIFFQLQKILDQKTKHFFK
jgi:hypothetical protein